MTVTWPCTITWLLIEASLIWRVILMEMIILVFQAFILQNNSIMMCCNQSNCYNNRPTSWGKLPAVETMGGVRWLTRAFGIIRFRVFIMKTFFNLNNTCMWNVGSILHFIHLISWSIPKRFCHVSFSYGQILYTRTLTGDVDLEHILGWFAWNQFICIYVTIQLGAR